MSDLLEWKSLRNIISIQHNDFCIIRGRENITLGEDVWIGFFTMIDGSGGLEIGNKVSISSGVHIYTHDTSKFRAFDLEKDSDGKYANLAPVKIGNNVQIGANSVISKGVTIGNNVIVGALCFVNEDIPDCSLVVGNPMKIIKRIDLENNTYASC